MARTIIQGAMKMLSVLAALVILPLTSHSAATSWQVGTPIVTYWAGPPMSDASANQMAEGGFNVVGCGEKDLDLVNRHGLRAQLHNGLLTPAALENASQKENLEALITRVKMHPALYAYFITDEPNATNFAGLGKLVAFLRERDPAHLAYINLFPTYASNEQLGNKGDKVSAYKEHLQQYIDTVKPALVSYDHYQFSTVGDNPDYFLNLALIRTAAQKAGVPFLNIVQACTWTPSMRVPTGDEMRYLVYTTLAYGAQGISYYVYSCPGHTGGIANSNGTPTVIYDALKTLNREFVAIAKELQPLRSLGVYHAGMAPEGSEALPNDAALKLDPPMAAMTYKPPERVRGALLGFFGQQRPTHVVVVNLDYKTEAVLGVLGAGPMKIFDATKAQWTKTAGARAELRLAGGAGKLIRIRP